ncbi:hypothetical protein [Burkholderia ubonensis]|uniref:hypothetical protein n=1 Tax=Burkholderia ubonensis TaxID=101571 RepID=UPI0012FCC9EB|nr:hypothetical protein [Burkholderia ubonensis]
MKQPYPNNLSLVARPQIKHEAIRTLTIERAMGITRAFGQVEISRSLLHYELRPSR